MKFGWRKVKFAPKGQVVGKIVMDGLRGGAFVFELTFEYQEIKKDKPF